MVLLPAGLRRLCRARDRLRDPSEPAPSVEQIAREVHLSPSHFHQQFTAVFGETPHQYLLTRRLERAAALLRNTDRSVADICFAVGLRSVGSFTTSFGRAYGMPPSAYRAAYPPASTRGRVPTCVLMARAKPAATPRQRATR